MKVIAPGLMTALLWSQIGIGLPGAVALTLLAILALFSARRVLDGVALPGTWAREAGFGERIWLNRLLVPIPVELNSRLTALYLVFWTGVLTALIGGLMGNLVLSLTGLLVAYTAQLVCFQKLADLYRVMRNRDPLYRFWTAAPVNDNKRTGKKAGTAGAPGA